MDMTTVGKDRFRRGFVILMTIAYATAFLALIGIFFVPLVLAAVFSGIAYPVFIWFREKFRGRANAAALTTLVISILAVLLPVIFLLGLVAEQAVEVTEDVAPWVQKELNRPEAERQGLPEWFPLKEKLEPYGPQIKAKLGHLAGTAGHFLASSLGRMSQGTAVFFFDIFIMLYAMFYFLLQGPRILDTILGYFPLTEADKARMKEVGLSVSRATIKGTLVIGLVQGALGGLGFGVAGIPAAVFWGAVMAVLSVIPGIGATLVWVPGVIYLLMSGHTVAGIALLAWCAGVVSTVDNVLRPILVGRGAEMPGLLILLSTLGGLALFGAPGLILGPVLAALFITVLTIYSHVFKDWLNPDDPPPSSSSED